ncbi:hypothetical protein DH86_00000802, partial [Scytalidium sp. 3C]
MVLVGCSRPYPKLPPRRPDPSSHVSHKGIYPDIPRTDTAGRMAAPASAYKDRQFIAVIGDEHVTAPPDSQKNFLVVDSKTENSAIEEAFDNFTSERKD